MTALPLEVAPRQQSWDELADAARGCVACSELAATRTHVVPGEAPRAARLLLVGEAPGAQEDETGRPFVGKAGQLLDGLLTEAGLDRGSVAVANVLKCRPPRNRKPRRPEVAACRPWLARQIELVDPLLVVTLGGTAAEWVVGPGARIATLRETDVVLDGRRVLCTYHPSAAIRFGPAGAPLAALRADLQRAAVLLEELA
ncbi:DNA polymerase [Motilibacter rhizosphaerae]|uniref:Type-4 uracil-DNA glycosylase n=1 Tax=Motilibacter rhizosphaerae TaxID=598652 RepID=A0A4Q7NT67_9ACTN|nr:uracil-DNA glycosylase [Motilibacter rhizosphaerae]RZS90353.1 DNA polymerase [Motilibacter rhizosphaerae]